MRRAVALGPLSGDLGMPAGAGPVAVVEGELGEQVVDVGLVEAVLAAVGDGEGLFGEGAVAVQPGQREQDGGLDLDQVDAAAAGEGFVEVVLGHGSLAASGVGPPQDPFGIDDVALVALDIGEAAGFAGGVQGGVGLFAEQLELGPEGFDNAEALVIARFAEVRPGGLQLLLPRRRSGPRGRAGGLGSSG